MIEQLLALAPVAARQAPLDAQPTAWCPAWAFWALAALVVIGAIATITRKNLISAVMALVATFFGLAGIYALLMAHFLAAILILVYAGAIMVLFIFVIMVLNHTEANTWVIESPVAKAIGIGGLVYFLVRIVEVIIGAPDGPRVRIGLPPPDFGSVASVGDYFFKTFLFPFESISILLVIAVIGAVVLSRTVSRPTTIHELPKEEQPHGPKETVPLGEDAAATDPHGGH